MKATILIAALLLVLSCNTGDNSNQATSNNKNMDGRNTIFLDTGRIDASMAKVSVEKVH